MKTLKKILLINWLCFSKQLIEVEDINFLTGKNGAGKSTIIDALQIVFLGELNTRNFNKAANESSQRTLDGYLRADMDEKSPCSPRGKDFSSYIACEFLDDQEGKQFVTGIVFDCRNDGSRQERFFIYDGPLPEHCFLVGRQAMDIPALRKYLTGLYGTRAKLYDSQKLAQSCQHDLPVFFWADIDLGGFQMFRGLQALFPDLQPMRMSAAEVEQYHAFGLERPPSYLKQVELRLAAHQYPLFEEAMVQIMKYGVTIEQEVFLYKKINSKIGIYIENRNKIFYNGCNEQGVFPWYRERNICGGCRAGRTKRSSR